MTHLDDLARAMGAVDKAHRDCPPTKTSETCLKCGATATPELRPICHGRRWRSESCACTFSPAYHWVSEGCADGPPSLAEWDSLVRRAEKAEDRANVAELELRTEGDVAEPSPDVYPSLPGTEAKEDRALPLGWRPTPLQPTEAMIDAGAQRLVSFEDNSVWPDSWSKLQIHAARNEAERVWRSMWLASEFPAEEPPE